MKVTGSLFIDPHHLVFHESKRWLQLSLSVAVKYLLFPTWSPVPAFFTVLFLHIARYQLFPHCPIPAFLLSTWYQFFFAVSGTCPVFFTGFLEESTSVVKDEPTWVASKVEMK